MDMAEDNSEPPPPPGPPWQLRFIDLNKHPKLRVHSLKHSGAVVNWFVDNLDVEGYSFATPEGLTRLWPAPEEDTAVV
jgi:hypothetical protein